MFIAAFKKYSTEDDATTAIEFSLLAWPFVMTVLAIIELGVFFATGLLLEGAVTTAARDVKTGQLQQMDSGDALTQFQQTLCQQADILINCENLQFQVAKLDSFNDDLQPEVDEEGNIDPPDQFEIDQITAGCVALVRVVNRYRFLTPLFADVFGNLDGNVRLQISTIVFQTEPYDFESDDPTCSV